MPSSLVVLAKLVGTLLALALDTLVRERAACPAALMLGARPQCATDSLASDLGQTLGLFLLANPALAGHLGLPTPTRKRDLDRARGALVWKKDTK